MIAARMCGRSLSGNSTPSRADCAESFRVKRPWQRAPRTRATRATRALAIQKVANILDRSAIAYSEPLSGKFVIEPHAGFAGGRMITFWPARARLRIGRRRTETHVSLHALQQALADQRHPIQGYLSRAKPPRPPRVSKAERLRERQESNLAEMEHGYAQRVAFFRQSLDDPASGIRRRDPRSARVKRLFRRAWLRPV
jgi:hypothetical protein